MSLAATVAGLATLRGTQRELFTLLDTEQLQKFYLDSAKSAWSYEDPPPTSAGGRSRRCPSPRRRRLASAELKALKIAARRQLRR